MGQAMGSAPTGEVEDTTAKSVHMNDQWMVRQLEAQPASNGKPQAEVGEVGVACNNSHAEVHEDGQYLAVGGIFPPMVMPEPLLLDVHGVPLCEESNEVERGR